MEKEDKRFALLIDGENVSAKYIKGILEELSNEGVITYKRIYGDWTSANMQRWKDVLLENSVTPIQQYSYTTGKNATDSAMIIDAMDILYAGNVEGFCLASSDSDFTRLASRLRFCKSPNRRRPSALSGTRSWKMIPPQGARMPPALLCGRSAGQCAPSSTTAARTTISGCL